MTGSSGTYQHICRCRVGEAHVLILLEPSIICTHGSGDGFDVEEEGLVDERERCYRQLLRHGWIWNSQAWKDNAPIRNWCLDPAGLGKMITMPSSPDSSVLLFAVPRDRLGRVMLQQCLINEQDDNCPRLACQT